MIKMLNYMIINSHIMYISYSNLRLFEDNEDKDLYDKW